VPIPTERADIMTSSAPADVVTSERPLLSATGLAAGYGHVPAIEGVHFEVAPGEVVAILGANASGKTTTLMALAGLLDPMAGSVCWLGEECRKPLHVRARQGMAYVVGDRGVISSLSTADNLRVGIGPVGRALELFPELRPLMKRRAGLLSGGEQKILALARALAADPKVVLADEFSLGLAPEVLHRLMDALAAAAERGTAVVLVEQQVVHALQFASRAYILSHGRVIMSGPTSHLLERIDEIETSYLVT
jgi:branched-chain amino acid transport system ATP-binding protein